MEYEELRNMPKIELHCHLDGSLSSAFMKEQLGRDVSDTELHAPDDCENLAEYLEKFDLPLQCIQSEKGMRRAGYDLIRSAAEENVRYIEVRFAPLLMTQEGLTTERILENVLDGLKEGKHEFGVESNIIVCAMRHHSEEDNLKMLKSARAFLGDGVCAADLAGNEAAFPMKGFADLFAQVKRMDMPFTLHAGECGSVQNILDSIEAGAARIGHGIAMRGYREVQEMCRKKQIGIEMCPISNLQTKAVRSRSEYPMREFLDSGLCVTVNTDNRTVSNTTVARELDFIQKNYGIREEEIYQMLQNAIQVSFADDSVKDRVWRECRDWL